MPGPGPAGAYVRMAEVESTDRRGRHAIQLPSPPDGPLRQRQRAGVARRVEPGDRHHRRRAAPRGRGPFGISLPRPGRRRLHASSRPSAPGEASKARRPPLRHPGSVRALRRVQPAATSLVPA